MTSAPRFNLIQEVFECIWQRDVHLVRVFAESVCNLSQRRRPHEVDRGVQHLAVHATVKRH